MGLIHRAVLLGGLFLSAIHSSVAQTVSVPDWSGLGVYKDANTKVLPPTREERVVFIGDSITDAWSRTAGKFFPGKPFLNRGISGQTTPQMLIRFRADVIALKPLVVMILGGINDINGLAGPMPIEATRDNLFSMADIAAGSGIKVVLCSLLPLGPARQPEASKLASIRTLNQFLRDYAAKHGFVYLDYYTAVVDGNQQLSVQFSDDGIHPNDAGYQVMTPLALKAIADALGEPADGAGPKGNYADRRVRGEGR